MFPLLEMWFKRAARWLLQRLRVGGVDLVLAWWRPVKDGLPLPECLESDTSSLPSRLWACRSQSRELFHCSTQNYRARMKKNEKENELDRLQWNEGKRERKMEIQWTIAIYLQQWSYSVLQALGSPISFSSVHWQAARGEIRTHCSSTDDNKDPGSGDNLVFMSLIMTDSMWW